MRQQQLVGADRRQERGAIVVEAPVPDSVFEVKQMLQLSVEGFNAHVATSIERPSSTRTEEAATLVTQTPMMLTYARFPIVRLTWASCLRTRHLGTEKAAAGATTALPFHTLRHR